MRDSNALRQSIIDGCLWMQTSGLNQGTSGNISVRVEDGFLRSKGLGARLIPPLSLVTDDLGIYYDPRRE